MRFSGLTNLPGIDTNWPPTDSVPFVGSSNPAINRKRVVFPQPLGPNRTNISPWFTVRSTFLTASVVFE